MTVRWQGRHHFDLISADVYEGLGGILQAPGTDFFVSANRGNDNKSGLSWAQPVATIQQAMTLAALSKYAGRGLTRVFVESGGYTGPILTPTNALCPFGALIGVNNNGMGYGPWIQGATAAGTILTLRARGWIVFGFEFDLPTTGKGIVLDGITSGANANYSKIIKCLFNGQRNSTYGIDYRGAPTFCEINDNIFYDIYNAGSTGQAITCTNSSNDNPQWARVLRNWFANNDKHISLATGSRGFKNGEIKDNSFMQAGNIKTATVLVNLTGGSNNLVNGNFANHDWDDIDTQVLVAGTNDIWGPNHGPEGVKYGDPT